MKFNGHLLLLLTSCLLVSSNATRRSLRKKTSAEEPEELTGGKTIANVMLEDGATVEFVEYEKEGIIAATKNIPPGATEDDDVEEAEGGPADVYTALTGMKAPERLIQVQEHMKLMQPVTPEDLPPPPPDDDDVPDENNDDDRRSLGTCNAAAWKDDCRYNLKKYWCKCLTCKSGYSFYRNIYSRAIMSKIKPYNGDVSHRIHKWAGGSWKLVAGSSSVTEGSTNYAWGWNLNGYDYWKATAEDADSNDEYNWYIIGYNPFAPYFDGDRYCTTYS